MVAVVSVVSVKEVVRVVSSECQCSECGPRRVLWCVKACHSSLTHVLDVQRCLLVEMFLRLISSSLPQKSLKF